MTSLQLAASVVKYKSPLRVHHQDWPYTLSADFREKAILVSSERELQVLAERLGVRSLGDRYIPG